jgi:FkbM family methyltransferase
MNALVRARQLFALYLIRPYTRCELPGSSRLYEAFVGGRPSDGNWQGLGPRRIKGKLHGYYMQLDLSGWSNRKTYFFGRFYDLPTQLLLKNVLRDGDTFVDIGANEGMMSLLAARLVGSRGRVIAFEPNPVSRGVFETAVADNAIDSIDIRPFGLSDSEATLELVVPSFNSGEGTFGESQYPAESVTRVRCPVRIGDRELAGQRPRLMKIDVEGFEEHVLRGLEETIGRTRPLIVMEMVGRHLRRAGSSIEALVSLLTGYGYRGLRLGLSSSRPKRLTLRPAAFSPEFGGDVLWAQQGDPVLGRQ